MVTYTGFKPEYRPICPLYVHAIRYKFRRPPAGEIDGSGLGIDGQEPARSTAAAREIDRGSPRDRPRQPARSTSAAREIDLGSAAGTGPSAAVQRQHQRHGDGPRAGQPAGYRQSNRHTRCSYQVNYEETVMFVT